MKILIIEDELPASKRLSQLINKYRPEAEIVDSIDSVEGAVSWFQNAPIPDLIFMDIQLSDGLSFDIFHQVEVDAPVIFTTAYDQYTLKAFKVNSIDYLLKPIDPEELERAFEQFDRLQGNRETGGNSPAIQELLKAMAPRQFKHRFLVKVGQQLTHIPVRDIAYFYSEGGALYALSNKGKRHLLDYTLEQLEGLLDPEHFFRINRKIITSVDAIHRIHTYFNSRLKLELLPRTEIDVIVSRDRVSAFKQWLDN